MSHREESPGRHAGETMSVSWPENAFWSHWRSWRKRLGRGKSRFFAHPTRTERKKISACNATWAPATSTDSKPTKQFACLSTYLTTPFGCKQSIMCYVLVTLVFLYNLVYIWNKCSFIIVSLPCLPLLPCHVQLLSRWMHFEKVSGNQGQSNLNFECGAFERCATPRVAYLPLGEHWDCKHKAVLLPVMREH